MTAELRLPVADVPSGTAHRLETAAGTVCVVRIEDAVYAIGDRCSHADVSLSEGEIDTEDCWIECWKHGSAFSLTDGEPQSLPATQPVPVYAARIEGEEIVVTVPAEEARP